jgi:steroid delta-isomerase-like uncharacterized protein
VLSHAAVTAFPHPAGEVGTTGKGSALDSVAIARTLYDARRRRDYDAAVEFLTEDVLLLNVATSDVYRGHSGFLEYARGWGSALPDLSFELMKIAGTEERVVVEYELEGAQTGSLVTPRGHLPATGMQVQLRFCDVLEVREGKVTHIRSYFDTSTLLRELGLITGTPLHAPERRAALELYVQDVDVHASERHKAIVQRFVQDVFNRQDPRAATDTCARTYLWHGGPLGEARGLTAYANVLAAFFIAFPDFHMEVLDMIAEDDRVVVRFTMRGTHLGDFQGIPATKKRVIGGGTSTYRIIDNRIAEEWWQGDLLTLLQQIDAAPSTPPLSS